MAKLFMHNVLINLQKLNKRNPNSYPEKIKDTNLNIYSNNKTCYKQTSKNVNQLTISEARIQ